MMGNEKWKSFKGEGYYRGGHYKGDGASHHRGRKNSRRSKVITFLERMNLKRSAIMEQLDKPEFQSITQVLAGELKAIDIVIDEFTQLFEIHENELIDVPSDHEKVEDSVAESKESLKNSEEGTELNETN